MEDSNSFLSQRDRSDENENRTEEQPRKSNTLSFAEVELDILVKTAESDNRPIVEEFIPEILALVNKFGNSGQSGGSAPYTAQCIAQTVKKLCLQQPIAPVTGHDDEWNDINEVMGKTNMWQNKRCGALFKGSDNKPYYLDAIVWKGDTVGSDGDTNWDTFSGSVEGIISRQYVKSFPFTPKTFYIDCHREKYDVEKHGMSARVVTTGRDGDVIYFIKDKEQLKEVFEYYDEFQPNQKAS